MKVMCSWCGATITVGDGDDDAMVSHGMCDECAATMESQLKAEQQERESCQTKSL
jgi:hypothetical protein